MNKAVEEMKGMSTLSKYEKLKIERDWRISDCETARRNLETVLKYLSLEPDDVHYRTIWKENQKIVESILESNLKVLVNK